MNATKLLRIIAIVSAALVLLGIMECLFHRYPHNFEDLFFIIFIGLGLCGFPAGVSGLLAFCIKNWVSQVILIVASILYGVYFAEVARQVSMMVDNQAGMFFIIVGFLSLPVMMPLWTAALVVEWWHWRKMKMEGAGQTPPPLQGDEK